VQERLKRSAHRGRPRRCAVLPASSSEVLSVNVVKGNGTMYETVSRHSAQFNNMNEVVHALDTGSRDGAAE